MAPSAVSDLRRLSLSGERGERRGRQARPGSRELGETEIEKLGSRGRQHDVAGLQVAVHHALAMRFVQRLGELDADAERLFERERAFFQSLGKRLALEQLHDDEVDTVLATDVVERADVRMVQARDRARLLLEALLELGVIGKMRRQHLDGDGAIEPCVPGFVDLAHTAGADGREDLERTELCSGFERHRVLGSLYQREATAVERAPSTLRPVEDDLQSRFSSKRTCKPPLETRGRFLRKRNHRSEIASISKVSSVDREKCWSVS